MFSHFHFCGTRSMVKSTPCWGSPLAEEQALPRLPLPGGSMNPILIYLISNPKYVEISEKNFGFYSVGVETSGWD